jgi:hypothetical protein
MALALMILAIPWPNTALPLAAEQRIDIAEGETLGEN